MTFRVVVSTIVLTCMVQATPAQAQCYQTQTCGHDCLEQFARDFAERNQWPYPYVCPDRESVRAPFALMVQNGWRRQNMLTEEHFKDGSAELTEAGRLKVQWIMTDVPLPHRMIFIRRADTVEKTSTRIQTVQKLAARLSTDGAAPVVSETTISPAGWPADRVDAISRKFQTSIPAPELPKSGDPASGGSGSK